MTTPLKIHLEVFSVNKTYWGMNYWQISFTKMAHPELSQTRKTELFAKKLTVEKW